MINKRKIFFVLCLTVAMCASILPLFASANSYYMPSSYITEYNQEPQTEELFDDDIIINIYYPNLSVPLQGGKLVEINCGFFPSEYRILEEVDGVIVQASPELPIFVSGYAKFEIFSGLYESFPITNAILKRKDTLYDFSYYELTLFSDSVSVPIYIGDPNWIYPEDDRLILPFDGITLTVDNNELASEESIRYEVLGSLFDIPRPEYVQFTDDYKSDITKLIQTIFDGIQSMFANDTYATIVYIFMAFSVGAMICFIIFKIWR